MDCTEWAICFDHPLNPTRPRKYSSLAEKSEATDRKIKRNAVF